MHLENNARKKCLMKPYITFSLQLLSLLVNVGIPTLYKTEGLQILKKSIIQNPLIQNVVHVTDLLKL